MRLAAVCVLLSVCGYVSSAPLDDALFRSVSARRQSNVLLSPATLSVSMATLLKATEGGAREELGAGLQLQEGDAAALPAALKGGASLLASSDLAVTSQPSDSVLSVDFSNKQEVEDTVNSWVRTQTQQLIQDLPLDPYDPNTQLLLVSAAAYTAVFSPPFNSSMTTEERFYVDRYSVAMVPTMLRSGRYMLAYDPALSVGVLKLTLADGVAMLVLLPDEGNDITDLEQEVTSQKIKAWIASLKKTKLEVQLPVFRMECSYWLKDSLKTLNVNQLFDNDIINVGGAKAATLSQVLHKALLSVTDSSDITAGSVTSDITRGGASLPPRLSINRPFLFLIYQEADQSLLLIGRLTDPSKATVCV